jgi:class 3 adenylate cyclase
MEHTTNRTFICSVVFLDIVDYSQQPVDEQIKLKSRFNVILAEAIKDVAVNDRIILDTGDGAAISFLGDPEDALFVALSIRDAIIGEEAPKQTLLSIRLGINLGPVKLVQDINGQRNLIGDGINVAQRVMSFAKPGQVLVSRSYFEVISRLSQEYAKLFHYEGSRADKHVREHQVYSVAPPEKEKEQAPAPPLPQKEEKKKAAATDLGTPSAPAEATADRAEARPPQPPREPAGPSAWQRLLTSANAAWLGIMKTVKGWSGEGVEGFRTLSQGGIKSLNWDTLRKNKVLLSIAALLIVLILGVPVMLWQTGGEPVNEPVVLMAPPPGAAPQAAEQAVKALPTEKGQSAEALKKTEPAPQEKAAQVPAAATPEQKKPGTETPSSATISLGIAPWGEVYIDGNKRGVSPPMNMVQVSPGKHEVEIRNTTFPPFKQAVDLKPGEQFKIRHRFR